MHLPSSHIPGIHIFYKFEAFVNLGTKFPAFYPFFAISALNLFECSPRIMSLVCLMDRRERGGKGWQSMEAYLSRLTKLDAVISLQERPLGLIKK